MCALFFSSLLPLLDAPFRSDEQDRAVPVGAAPCAAAAALLEVFAGVTVLSGE